MGARFSAADNGNVGGSSGVTAVTVRSGASGADTAVDAHRLPRVTAPSAGAQPSVAVQAVSTGATASGGAPVMAGTGAVPKVRRRLSSENSTTVLSRRQLLDMLAANGVNGRPAASRNTASGQPGATSSGAVALNQTMLANSVPFLIAFRDVNCPVCHKMIPSDDVECHLVMCLTKPRITYNEDVLSEDKEQECAICLDELKQGDTVARLPCLCIYHKSCIDQWFQVNRSCPEHPDGTTA